MVAVTPLPGYHHHTLTIAGLIWLVAQAHSVRAQLGKIQRQISDRQHFALICGVER
jgi:hypothetical protein